MFYVHEEEQQVSISADPVTPFSAQSLYEFYQPCDRIRFIDDAWYGGYVGMECWYGTMDYKTNHRRLLVMKRRDGDLIVWPTYPFPPDHRCWQEG